MGKKYVFVSQENQGITSSPFHNLKKILFPLLDGIHPQVSFSPSMAQPFSIPLPLLYSKQLVLYDDYQTTKRIKSYTMT